jgi:hypothetical protein
MSIFSRTQSQEDEVRLFHALLKLERYCRLYVLGTTLRGAKEGKDLFLKAPNRGVQNEIQALHRRCRRAGPTHLQ